ncbi:hypothetical protein V6Z12_A05G113500 [Gossypium hirsutum]
MATGSICDPHDFLDSLLFRTEAFSFLSHSHQRLHYFHIQLSLSLSYLSSFSYSDPGVVKAFEVWMVKYCLRFQIDVIP